MQLVLGVCGSTKPQLNTQTSSSHTGVLLTPTKRSRDGGEEQSIPAVKRRRVDEETSMLFPSGLESESVHGESVTPTGHISYQHQRDDSTFQPPSQLHLPLQTPAHPVHLNQVFYQPPRQSPSQLPPPPHPNRPLEKYALFLRGYYTQHHAPSTKWPPLDTRKYINLAVINNVYANRQELVGFREQIIRRRTRPRR